MAAVPDPGTHPGLLRDARGPDLGRLITFNSRRASDWEHPPDVALTLRMDIWARTGDGEFVQLTRYDDETRLGTRAVTSDYAWGPDGRHIVSYRGEVTVSGDVTQIVDVLTLDGDY